MPEDTSNDILDRDEIIRQISEVHNGHSTDPETLCSASMLDFDANHPNLVEALRLRGVLYFICKDADEPWTRW